MVLNSMTGSHTRLIGRLHILTDARPGRDALEMVTAAAIAGAGVIQVRAKGLTDRELCEFAQQVMHVCRKHGVTCIINDRVDIALAVGAHGTHLGNDDLPISAVRRIAGPNHLIGGTTRSAHHAAELVACGADYLGVGPAYATETKAGLPAPLGPAGIAAVAHSVAIPVIAIGGVTAERVPELVAAGAHGVAVVSAVSDAVDPLKATSELLDRLPSEFA